MKKLLHLRLSILLLLVCTFVGFEAKAQCTVPVAHFAPTLSNICKGQEVSITNYSVGTDITYEWKVLTPSFTDAFADGSVTITSGTVNSATPKFRLSGATGTYTFQLFVTDKCNKTVVAGAPVTVKSVPVATLPADISYCGPKTIAFSTTSANHKPTYDAKVGTISSYLWTVNGAPYANTANPTIDFPTAGTYTVTVTASNECGASDPATQVITILEQPEPPVIEEVGACKNSSVTLWVKSHAPGVVYRWYDAAGLPLVSGNSYTTPVLTSNVTYYVEAATVATPSCISSTRTEVNVTVSNPPGGGQTISSDQTICSGAVPAALTGAAPSGGGTTYQWYESTASSTSGFTPIATGKSKDYLPPAQTVTKWYKRAIYSGGCVQESNVVKITVVPMPPKPVADNVSVCSGSSATLSVKSLAPDAVYKWYESASTPIWAGSGVSFTTPVLMANKSYWVEASTTAPSNCVNPARTEVKVSVTSLLLDNNISADQSICAGGKPLALTGSLPSGGGGGYTYQWEYSVDGTIYTEIAGANGQDYAPGALMATTWFRRKVNASGACPENTSNAVKITATPLPVSLDVADTKICYASKATLTIATPDPNLTYYWYDVPSSGTALGSGVSYTTYALTSDKTYYVQAVSKVGCFSARRPVFVTVTARPATPDADDAIVCSGNSAVLTVKSPDAMLFYRWYDATGTKLLAIGESFITDPLSASGSYYVEAVTKASPGCASTARKLVTVSVAANITNNLIGTDQAICSGTIPVALKGTLPAGSGGGYTYQWQSSTDGALFADIAGATAKDYAPGALTATTWFRRKVKAVVACPENISAPVVVNVSAALATPDADDVTVCSGEAAILSVKSPDASLTYNWYAVASGGAILKTGPIFNAGVLTSGKTYYVEAVNTGCKSARKAVSVTAVTPLPPTPDADNVTICAGSSVELKVKSPNPAFFFYRWYNAAGDLLVTGDTYTTPVLTTNATYYVEAVTVASPGCSNASSKAVTVTVQSAVSNNIISADQAICQGVTPLALNGSIPTGGGGGYTYQWQSSADGTLFADIAGATAKDYAPGALAATTWFRRKVKAVGPCAEDFSMPVKIDVIPPMPAPDADNLVVCSGQKAVLSVKSPDGATTYNWYAVATGGAVLRTGATFDVGILTSDRTYYVEASKADCISPRRMVTVTVVPLPGAPSINNTTACAGSTATLSINTPDGTLSYRWYDAGGTWLTTGTTYTTLPLTATTTYTVRAVNASDCFSPAKTVTVTVIPVITNNTVADNQVICVGQTPSAITGSSPTGGGGGYTYQWQSSADGTLFTNIAGATSKDYAPSALTTTTWFRRKVTTAVACSENISDPVEVTVASLPAMPDADNLTVCSGQKAAFVVKAPDATFTYRWYDAGGVLLADGHKYETGLLTSDATYYVEAVSASNCVSPRRQVTVTVSALPATPAVDDVTICSGNTADLKIKSPSLSFVYRWYDAGGTILTTGTSYTTLPLTTNKTYYVEAVMATAPGCASPRRAVTVTVNPQPAAPDLDNAVVCTGSSATLSVKTPSALTYDWYDAGGILVYTGTSYSTPALTVSTSYYVEAVATTFPFCASPRRVVTVTVDAPPAAPEADDVTVCSGSNATIAVKSPDVALSYRWYTVATGGTAIGTGASLNLGAVTSGGTYYVEARSKSGAACVSDRKAVNVIVAANAPTPDADNKSICAGSTVELKVKSSDAATYFYHWYDAPVAGKLLAIGTTYTTPILSANATYYVEAVTVAAPNCSSPRKAVTVSVIATIANNTVSAAQAICSGETPASLIGTIPTGGGGGYTYQWQSSTDGTLFTDIAGAISKDHTPGPLTTTTWYKRKVKTPGACSENLSASIKITVAPLPAMPDADNVPVCSGDVATLQVNSPDGALTYRWYTVATGGKIESSGHTFKTSVLTSGRTYYVEAVNATGCMSPRKAVNVTVAPLPDMPDADNAIVCSGQEANLKIKSSDAAMYYRWYDAAGDLLTTGTTYTTLTLTASTTYYVEAVNTSGCASPRKMVAVTVTPVPATPVVEDKAICVGEQVTLSVQSSHPAYTYRWYESDGSYIKTGVNHTTPILTADRIYFVEAVSVAAPGCLGARRTVTVTVAPLATTPSVDDVAICAGGSAVLKINTADPAYTYNWYTVATGGTPESSGTTFNTNVLTSTQTYYVEAIASTVAGTSTTCASPRKAVTVTVNALPAAPLADAVTICEGDKAALAVKSPDVTLYTYRWYDAGGTFLATGATYTTPVPVPASAVYYVETVTKATGCVSATRRAVAVIVTPKITNNIIGTNQGICAGGTPLALKGELPAGGGGGYTYQWQSSPDGTFFSDITGANGQSYPPGALTTPTWFRRKVTTATGPCGESYSNPVKITVNEIPDVPTANDVTICSGEEAVLSVADLGYTYRWYTTATGVTPIKEGSVYTTANLTSDATYYVEAVTSSNCTSPRKAVKVTVSSLPAVPMADPVTICAGEKTTLAVKSPDITLYTYNWYDSKGGFLGIGTSIPTPVLSATTTYYVEAVAKATNCVSPGRKAVVVNVLQLPNVPVVENPTICAGEKATLVVKHYDAALTYKWYSDAAGTTLLGTGGTYTSLTPLYTDTPYFVEAVNARGCTSITRQQVDVKVTSKPDAPVANDVTICAGSSATLAVATPEADVIYKWFDANGVLLYTGETYTTVPLSSKATFNVAAYTKTSKECASDVTAVTVNIAAPLANNTISGSQTICSSTAPAKLGGSVPTGGSTATLSYQWQSSTDGVNFTPIAGAYSQDYAPGALTADIWFRRVARFVGPCGESISNTVKVSVIPAPAVPVVNDQRACIGNSAILKVQNPSSTSGNINYRWYNVPSGGQALFTGITFVTPALYFNTTYYVEAVNGNGCASTSRRAIQITIDEQISNNTISSSQVVCVGNKAAALLGSQPEGGYSTYTYQWQRSADGVNFIDIAAATGVNYIPTESFTKTAWFRRKVKAGGPCAESTSAAVKIEVVSTPVAPTVTSAAICPGISTTLTARAMAGLTVEWYDAAEGGSLLFIGDTYTTPVLSATTSYWVQTVNSSGCESTRQEAIVQVVGPQITISEDLTIIEGKTAQLKADGGATYTWSAAEGISNLDIANPIVKPTKSTTYVVEITTKEGCVVTKQVTVTVLPKINVTNVITPNGDGYNDRFEISEIENYPNCTIEIYTRWGERVYESKGYGEPWNGTKNGNVLPAGAYYYIIKLDSKTTPISGSVTIVK